MDKLLIKESLISRDISNLTSEEILYIIKLIDSVCDNKLELETNPPRTFTCHLQRGHEGFHQSEDGFPWEDNPMVYLAPIWIFRNAVCIEKDSNKTIRVVLLKQGKSEETSYVKYSYTDSNVVYEVTLKDFVTLFNKMSYNLHLPL